MLTAKRFMLQLGIIHHIRLQLYLGAEIHKRPSVQRAIASWLTRVSKFWTLVDKVREDF